jgi:uncharacterized protein (DUF433 family)
MTSTLAAPTSFISFDDRGRPFLTGTTYKVQQIAIDHVHHGMSPDEIRRQHYNAFTLAQVHAALSYYFEHQAAFDAEIEREYREYEQELLKQRDLPHLKKLRQRADEARAAVSA